MVIKEAKDVERYRSNEPWTSAVGTAKINLYEIEQIRTETAKYDKVIGRRDCGGYTSVS